MYIPSCHVGMPSMFLMSHYGLCKLNGRYSLQNKIKRHCTIRSSDSVNSYITHCVSFLSLPTNTLRACVRPDLMLKCARTNSRVLLISVQL